MGGEHGITSRGRSRRFGQGGGGKQGEGERVPGCSSEVRSPRTRRNRAAFDLPPWRANWSSEIISDQGYALDACSLREGVGTARPHSRRAPFPGDRPSPPPANSPTNVKSITPFPILR